MPARIDPRLQQFDDECFDLGDSRPAPRTPAEVVERVADDSATRQANVLYLSLLCQSGTLVTEVTSPISGDAITDDYRVIFFNDTPNPVRVQVFADLVTPGCGAILSLGRDAGDQGKYDALSLTANGRTESVSMIVLPNLSIYARNFSAIPMAAQDTLRMRLFDPQKLLSYMNLYGAR